MRSLIWILAGALVLATVGCSGDDQGGTSSAGGSEGGGGSTGTSGATGTGGSASGTGGTGGTGGAAEAPAFAEVYDKVFKAGGCTNASCHYGNGFDLSDPAQARAQMVDAPASGGCGEFVRVAPGKPAESLVYLKVSMTAPPCGARMPLNAAPLAASQIALLEAWITAGAPE